MNLPDSKMVTTDILIVDDNLNTVHLLSTLLEVENYTVCCAVNGYLALDAIALDAPKLILIALGLTDMDGYELCARLKAQESSCHIPIIFISTPETPLDTIKAFEVGGVDYIIKPFESIEVLARVKHQLILQAAHERIAQLNLELDTRVATRTAQLEAEVIVRKRAQANLKYLVLHDTLTNLPNRTWFMEHLAQALHQAKQDQLYQFAVLFFDCDHFKVINDSLGHLVGDQLLICLAQRLKECLPSNSILARLGGDEFVIFIEKLVQESDAIEIAQHVQQTLKQSFQLEGRNIFISASIGIVLGHVHYHQPDELLRDADTAMYHAKAKGTGRYQVFDQVMYRQALERLELEQDLRLAIQNQEFVLHYQPILSLATREIEGFEALIRWQHPRYGLVFPDRFIPLAEEVGLIHPIGLWVLAEACQQINTWQAQFFPDTTIPDTAIPDTAIPERTEGNLCPGHPSFQVNVNISASQLAYPNFLDDIDCLINASGINNHCLKLEITESALMQDSDSAHQILEKLKSRHIQLVIDDFGTGYSSLSYLHRFPLDTLKIDRSFTFEMHKNPKRLGIVESTIDLAHKLGMNVVAEGIETDQQLNTLRQFGCESGQGYLFSKPIAPHTLSHLSHLSIDALSANAQAVQDRDLEAG